MRILVADDEPDYCRYLAAYLKELGHEVDTASSGQAAILAAIEHVPDVVIADWMLKVRTDGLVVCECVRLLNPSAGLILVTDLPSDDLRQRADRARVDKLIEKPFGQEDIESALATLSREEHPAPVTVPVVVTTSELSVIYANPPCCQLLPALDAVHTKPDLRSILSEGALQLVDITRDWMSIPAASDSTSSFLVHGRKIDSGYAFVILGDDSTWLRNDPAVRQLLGIDSPSNVKWKDDRHVLLYEPWNATREMYGRLLEACGCTCFAAGSEQQTLNVAHANNQIGVVILNCDGPPEDTALLIEDLRANQPLTVIGTFTDQVNCQLELDAELKSPWSAEQIAQVLASN